VARVRRGDPRLHTLGAIRERFRHDQALVLNEADAHLARVDGVLKRLIAEGGPLPTEPDSRGRPAELYGALVRSIAGQQLSVKAAASIYKRLTDHFGGQTPTPEQILEADPDTLRQAAGFSRAKVQYLRSLAEHVVSRELELDRLNELPDEEVIAELTAVKGIGEWTAHMFLMFTLHRPDVLPLGDLGVRNAMARLYDDPPDTDAWRPYRTRACLYLWRSLDNTPQVSA
jgi:DNA-3-methyladenine glycosylase II